MNAIKVLCLLVIIEQNPMSKVPKLVPAWHEELLLEKFGEDRVKMQEQVVRELAPVVLEEEIQRLMAQYGVDEETRVPIFQTVYGRGSAGARRLQAAIDEAVAAAEKPVKAAKAKAPAKAPAKAKAHEAGAAGDEGEGEGEDTGASAGAALEALSGADPLSNH